MSRLLLLLMLRIKVRSLLAYLQADLTVVSNGSPKSPNIRVLALLYCSINSIFSHSVRLAGFSRLFYFIMSPDPSRHLFLSRVFSRRRVTSHLVPPHRTLFHLVWSRSIPSIRMMSYTILLRLNPSHLVPSPSNVL